jgi:hypothetical protein
VHFNRDALVQALNEVSWTAEKQARVIEGLERLVQQLQRDMRKERLLNERSQKQMLNEQDQFIEALIAEHEETLTKVVAERDEALRQIERLELLVPQSDTTPESSGLPPGGTSGPRRGTTQEAVELRQQLGLAKRRIGKLTSECRRSRDVLHRVMRQRDEAQLAVAQLVHEIRDSVPQHRPSEHGSWSAAGVEGGSAPPGVPLSADPDQRAPFEENVTAEERDIAEAAGGDRATPTATASPSLRPSPLAIALASTHPERRRSKQRSARGWQRESITLPGVAPEGRDQPAHDDSSEDESQ